MRKFIIKIGLFVLPLFVLLVLLEVFYRVVPNNYNLKYHQINKKCKAVETLFFGDSHCMYGLNPKYFHSKAFNLSNVSQSLYFDQLLFDAYLDKSPQLKQVVFCIEYTNFSQKENGGDDGWRKFYYQKFMHLNVPLISSFDPRNYLLCVTQNFYKSRDLVKRFVKRGTILDCDDSGWGNNYKKDDRIPPWQVARNRALVQEDGSMDFETNKNRLKDIIRKCKRRNIQVLIVSMPQTKIYSSYLNPKKLDKIVKTCRQFQLEHPKYVFYLNLFDDLRFQDEDFFDADHLNDQGATKCSLIVDDYLQFMKR